MLRSRDGTVIVGLLVGFGGLVMAQDDEEAGAMTAQMLDDNAREAWNNDDVALLEATYAGTTRPSSTTRASPSGCSTTRSTASPGGTCR